MSFEKIFHEENRQQQTLLKHCFFLKRKIDKSQSVCMTSEKKQPTWCALRARYCRINRAFIRESRANVMFHIVRKINFEGMNGDFPYNICVSGVSSPLNSVKRFLKQ